MIDDYNDCTDGPRIWRRINPNWDYKEDILRKTRDDVYLHTRYSKFRPELFDWEKAVLGEERRKLKSFATVSRLNFRECTSRNKRLCQLKTTNVWIRSWLEHSGLGYDRSRSSEAVVSVGNPFPLLEYDARLRILMLSQVNKPLSNWFGAYVINLRNLRICFAYQPFHFLLFPRPFDNWWIENNEES